MLTITTAALVAVAILVAMLVVNRRGQRALALRTTQLAESEARWRRLAETAPAGIFHIDPDGRRLYVNPKLTEITGDPSSAPGDARVWVVHEPDLPLVQQTWAAAAETLSEISLTFRIRRLNDSEVRWVNVEARPLLDAAGALDGWVGSTVDVTEETSSIANLRRFSEILEATPDLVAMVDARGHFTYANAAARARFAIDTDEKMAKLRAIDVYAPTSRSHFLGDALPTANRMGVWSGEVDLLLPDGTEIPVSQVLVAHRRPDGSIDYYSSITRDLTEKREIELELARVGMYDNLTGLPQRPVFVEALGQAMEASIESGVQVAVLLLGLDHFKLVNDSFGHDSGDLMLRLVTQRLELFARPGDLLARFSGDVFCMLVNAVPSEAEALRIADEIAAAMAAPYQLDGDQVFVTMSVGIAMSGGVDSVATPETMLRDADAALHRAKERGRARSELFVEDYRATAVHRLRTANDLHRALTEQEFRVVYQPEVDLRTGHVTGVEALVRWHHPERGLVPPGEFIPLAEQTGLIAGIGAWVLDTALAQAAHWTHSRYDGSALTVWVNLSARQLGDPGLVELVAASLLHHGVDAAQLGLEITESALLEDAEGAVTALSSLRELGVRLAVDDFGTGYSSLSYLKRLPVDAVKIDRSFVDGLAVDGDDSAIVAAVAGMARALRLTTIAEGVENLDQLQALKRLGCDLAQGFFFTTPQPPSHINRLLESDRGLPLFHYEDTEAVPTQRGAVG